MGFPHCGFFPGGHPLNFLHSPHSKCCSMVYGVVWQSVFLCAVLFSIAGVCVCVWQLCTMKLNQCYMMVIEGKVLYGGMWEGVVSPELYFTPI